MTSVRILNFDAGKQSFGTGIKEFNNPVVVVSGSDLPRTTVVNVSGYSCNITANLTASNFYKIPFYTAGVYGYLDPEGTYKYNYPSINGYSSGIAAVCLGNSIPKGTSVVIEVKTMAGGGIISRQYTTVQ